MADKTPKIANLSFDVEEITAVHVDDFLRANRENDMREQSRIMALYATDCPKEWGAWDDPETYSNLKFKTFVAVRELFTEGLADLTKN